MAAEIVETTCNLLRLSNKLPPGLVPANTDREPLPGAVGWPADDDSSKVAAQVAEASGKRLPAPTCLYLAERYGTRAIDIARIVASEPDLGAPLVPGRPEIVAQIDWAVKSELAATVSDFLVRRTQLYFRDVDQGLGCVEVVASRMARLLGVDRVDADGYRTEVARSRAWRDEPA
jgi:glycerol-3-phosphate dehydrogenase